MVSGCAGVILVSAVCHATRNAQIRDSVSITHVTVAVEVYADSSVKFKAVPVVDKIAAVTDNVTVSPVNAYVRMAGRELIVPL